MSNEKNDLRGRVRPLLERLTTSKPTPWLFSSTVCGLSPKDDLFEVYYKSPDGEIDLMHGGGDRPPLFVLSMEEARALTKLVNLLAEELNG